MEQISINITKYKQHNDEIFIKFYGKMFGMNIQKNLSMQQVQNSIGLINNKMMVSTMLL